AFNQMPHPLELWVGRKFIQLLTNVLRRQIDPTNNCCDEWILICKTQQPASFFDSVAGLDQNRFLNAASFEDRFKCRWQIILTKNFDFWRHPWIVKPSYLPEVLVAIDYHRLPLPLGDGWEKGLTSEKRQGRFLLFTNTLT